MWNIEKVNQNQQDIYKDLWQTIFMEEFDKFIKNLIAEFSANNSYGILKNIKYQIKWPEGYGVYTLWHKDISYNNLIYVGLTGKYKRNNDGEIILNSGSFSHRSSRFTPYRFCDSTKDSDDFRFTFRYGPKYSKTNIQGKHKYDDDSYKNTVAYSDLVIATFNVANMKDYTPSYLESLVLTKYLAEEGNLPPANNEL